MTLGSTSLTPSPDDDGASFTLLPPQLPPTLTVCRSDAMTGDQWALSSLEVAPGVTPRVPALFDLPSSSCRAVAPSDFPVRGETGVTVQKFLRYFLSDNAGAGLAAAAEPSRWRADRRARNCCFSAARLVGPGSSSRGMRSLVESGASMSRHWLHLHPVNVENC